MILEVIQVTKVLGQLFVEMLLAAKVAGGIAATGANWVLSEIHLYPMVTAARTLDATHQPTTKSGDTRHTINSMNAITAIAKSIG